MTFPKTCSEDNFFSRLMHGAGLVDAPIQSRSSIWKRYYTGILGYDIMKISHDNIFPATANTI